MKKFITMIIIIAIALTFSVTPTYAMPKGIDSYNYDDYTKSVSDTYGFNKGECDTPYLAGEEYFYNKYYDHWNVDKVYDSSKVTSRKLAIAFAKANYPKYKIVIINYSDTDKFWNKILHRKNKKINGKKVIYIERTVSISSGGKHGYTVKGHYYIAYNKSVKKGKKVYSYSVWNPKNNYCDDVIAVADCKMIRSDFSTEWWGE